MDDRVVHHDHKTGKIFGLAHNKCNLRQRTQSFTPVFFNNLSRYDSHHLIQNLSLKTDEKLSIIPCTEENYISFSLHIPVGNYISKAGVTKVKYEEVRFLDSFRFLPESLDKLSKSLREKDLKILEHFFPKPEHKRLMTRKGVYPYSSIDGYKKFELNSSEIRPRLDEQSNWTN